MSAIAKAAFFWRSASQGMRRTPFVHFIAVLVLAIALFVAGLVFSAVQWLESLAGTLGDQVEVTVYLAADAGPQQATALQDTLVQVTGGRASVVTPADAMRRLQRDLGELGSVLDGVPNPLPLSVELRVPPEVRTPALLHALVEKIERLPGVAGVDWNEEAATRLHSLVRLLTWGGLLGLLIAVVAVVVVVAATLQLAIYARREEIEIQKLVGATHLFVRSPFLIEGLLQGLLGSALALAALGAFQLGVAPQLAKAAAFLAGPDVSAAIVTPVRALELILAGLLLGFCGSLLAVGRFLRR